MQGVITIVRIVTGSEFVSEVAERQSGDQAIMVPSSVKARRELGSNPRYAELSTIIDHAGTWHQKWFGENGTSS